MRRLEDEIGQLRDEIEALDYAFRPVPTTEPTEERYLPIVGYLVRGEEVPEALLDEVFADEEGKFIKTRDYLDVVREMIADGVFSDEEVEEEA